MAVKGKIILLRFETGNEVLLPKNSKMCYTLKQQEASMGAYTKLDRYFCLFLVASLLLAILNFAHLFCKVDYSLAFEAVHACNHLFTNHVCNAWMMLRLLRMMLR